MTAHTRLSALLAASCLAATCGGGTPVPTSPSAAQSFLTGTWTGTLTIDREGEPSTSGAATWTFAPVDGTNLQTFSVTIRSPRSQNGDLKHCPPRSAHRRQRSC